MQTSETIAVVLALAGAAVIVYSASLGLRAGKALAGRPRDKWRLAMFLLFLSAVGYLIFIAAILRRAQRDIELVAAVMVFLGAGFVNRFIRLTFGAIEEMNEKDRELALRAEGLRARAADLEREAMERAHAEDQASLHIQYLSALHEVEMVLGSTLDLGVTLRAFLERAVSQLQADAASVLLMEPSANTLRYAAGLGFRTPLAEQAVLRPGEGAAGRAAAERRLVALPDLRESPEALGRRRLADAEGFVSYYAAPLVAKGEVKGVFEVFFRRPVSREAAWLAFLEALALHAAIAIENAALFENLQRSKAEVERAYDTTLEGWARALELRDKETVGHTLRVTEATLRLAGAMGLSGEALEHIRRGAMLHDIGKMSIPDSILMKAGPLTDEERAVMRGHPVHAFELLSPIPYLHPAIDIPYCHHERWDGTGYPRGLKGKAIPLPARIFAVIDIWDALRSERRYEPAWSKEKACGHIRSLSGSHFDPEVVEAFLAMECGGRA
jgi:putative nucleotidyltransferase with HDIG domain